MKNIIWALDPFSEDRELSQSTAACLHVLRTAMTQPSAVEAVFVINPDQTTLPFQWFDGWAKEFVPQASVALEKRVFENLGGSSFKVSVLVCETPSQTAAAEHLLAHAQSTQADLIVLSRSGLSGLSSVILGSFAEALLDATQQTPLLMVPPMVPMRKKFSEVLFPTLFTKSAHLQRAKVAAFCKEQEASLTLYTQVSDSKWAAYFQVPQNVRSAQSEQINQLSLEWMEYFRAQGISCRALIEKSGEPVAKRLGMVVSEHGTDLLLLVAERKGVSKHLGSVVKKILQSTKVPVLVIPEAHY